MKILVTGATGSVGRHVTRALVERGAEVRVLTRNPAAAGFPDAVEVVAGDLARPETLRPALAGVERMYLFPHPDTAGEVVALAKEAGVRRVVVLSSAAAADGSDTTHHTPVERAVAASGLEWTHVRPGEFMGNKVSLWAASIRAERLVREPFPDSAWAPVHERDIADVAVAALLEDGHAGAAYTLHGPETSSRREQVAAIAAALGEEVALVEVSREEARERYVTEGGFPPEVADFMLGFTDYDGRPMDADAAEFDVSGYGELTSLKDAIGEPGRTFAEWAREHVADFR
ncbi:SDR family oxidoreductase [Streptomyces sp. NPDC020412]|uniref:SDR family oxidoreductase n=1 Tax=Streptomyces sp. NPDC020412 TaxID=3365073 RepID=UPI003787B089